MSDKELIIQNIQDGNVNSDEFGKLLERYLSENPNDYDRFSILVNSYIQLNDLDKALESAKEAQRLNPYYTEASYNLAEVFYLKADYFNAAKYFMRVKAISEKRCIEIVDADMLNDLIEECKSHLNNDACELLENLIRYAADDPFRKVTSLAGQIFTDEAGNKAYIGIYNNWTRAYCGGIDYPDNYEYELFPVESIGNAFRYEIKGDYIAPIVGIPFQKDETNWIRIDEKNGNKSSTIPVLKEKTYNYLRLNGTANIASINPVVFGKPVILKHHPNNKKLIINLFIDSFNYRFFELNAKDGNPLSGFQKLMPNTYDFFSDGVICTNAYSDSEWTTPSLSSYWTGQYSYHHMNLYEHLWWTFPDDVKLLPEYFKENGYMTVRLGENQESANPSQGYMRGTNRFLAIQGHNDSGKFISEAIDQIEAFSECDQFIWINFEDLHKIAGSFDSDISIQTHTPVHYLQQDNEGTTTVKQGRSKNKQVFAEKELTRLDRNLGVLFAYLKSNYKDDEYIVTLFSDHGTAFMVDDDKPMICDQRTHIPMMFYDGKHKGVCDEFVQNVDFGAILCKLAGVSYNYKNTDSQLPVFFGGEKKREYVLSQTIYIGDPYQAMIKDKENTFYYKTKACVSGECRIDKTDAECTIISNDEFPDSNDKISKYKNIIEFNTWTF